MNIYQNLLNQNTKYLKITYEKDWEDKKFSWYRKQDRRFKIN